MKTAKITDYAALKEWLGEVQAKSRVRTIDVVDIESMCNTVSERLGIAKKAMEGVKFCADYNAQAFPNAYKGRPESTLITAEYKRSGWVITKIFRGDCRRPTVAYTVELTDAAKEAIIRNAQTFGF